VMSYSAARAAPMILPPVIREVAQMIDGAYGTLIDREMPLSIPN